MVEFKIDNEWNRIYENQEGKIDIISNLEFRKLIENREYLEKISSDKGIPVDFSRLRMKLSKNLKRKHQRLRSLKEINSLHLLFPGKIHIKELFLNNTISIYFYGVRKIE